MSFVRRCSLEVSGDHFATGGHARRELAKLQIDC